MLQNLKTNLSQCPTEPVDAEPGPPPPVCDGEKMIYFLKTSGAKTILLAYILYKHTSIILSFKETNRPAPMASVALKSDKSATSFPIVATRPTRRVVQQISSLTSAPRYFRLFVYICLCLCLCLCLVQQISSLTSAPRCFRCFQTHFSLYFVYICLYFVFKRGTPPECLPLANSSPPITTGPLLLPPPGLLLAG